MVLDGPDGPDGPNRSVRSVRAAGFDGPAGIWAANIADKIHPHTYIHTNIEIYTHIIRT